MGVGGIDEPESEPGVNMILGRQQTVEAVSCLTKLPCAPTVSSPAADRSEIVRLNRTLHQFGVLVIVNNFI